MRSIVEDNRAPMTPRSQIPPAKAQQQSEEPQKPYKHGWAEAPPVRASGGDGWAYQTADEIEAQRMGLTHAEWSRLSEADLKARKEQQERKLRDKGGPQK
jgi:hypothetical protein